MTIARAKEIDNDRHTLKKTSSHVVIGLLLPHTIQIQNELHSANISQAL